MPLFPTSNRSPSPDRRSTWSWVRTPWVRRSPKASGAVPARPAEGGCPTLPRRRPDRPRPAHHRQRPDWLTRGPLVVANGRWVPPADFSEPGTFAGRPWVGTCEGVPAFAVVGPEDAVGLAPGGVDAWFEDLIGRSDHHEVGGEWINRPWDLVAKNADHLIRDFALDGKPTLSNRHLASAAIVGPSDRLSIHETAKVDPYTVFDTTNGPISIAAGAWIQPFTRIEGPCHVGRDTQLFRANVRGGTTIGPNCRIGGEVEASIVHGHSNKYHEGFLGHAYVGEWVNLGAITSNSDLRNDYGEVHVPSPATPSPPARPRSAASSATTPGPAWGACSTPGHPSE